MSDIVVDVAEIIVKTNLTIHKYQDLYSSFLSIFRVKTLCQDETRRCRDNTGRLKQNNKSDNADNKITACKIQIGVKGNENKLNSCVLHIISSHLGLTPFPLVTVIFK